ncbi:hypothetical protein BGW80DRAFT_1357001 [Lactifluus volemus]|nr:hypothetical protein BGW80DRAFT_1357001 [Lactifluus volemus]
MAFRGDVHLMMATSGLCEWLLRIANSVSLVMLDFQVIVKFRLSFVILCKTIFPLPTPFPLPSTPQTRRAGAFGNVAWAARGGVASHGHAVPPDFAAWRLRLVVL